MLRSALTTGGNLVSFVQKFGPVVPEEEGRDKKQKERILITKLLKSSELAAECQQRLATAFVAAEDSEAE